MKENVFKSLPVVLRQLSDRVYSGELEEFNLGVVREAVIAQLLKEGTDVCDGGKLWGEFKSIWDTPAVEEFVCDWMDEEYERL